MPLDSGTRLGPYEIASLIGAGGMGEVYRARDTRLDRTVAIKVLPSHLAADPERRERFEREARVVSSLSHPHICTLYDVGHQDTAAGPVDFLVMEYLQGVTLAERLEKGALPVETSLRHAIEIADGLDKAHRQGIVHRDLKPGNIMLTKAGATLLDFGLAKLKHDAAGAAEGALSALATQQRPLTQEGALVGTFQYMSPEQLEGKEPDARSDLWALGLVLYEMVTGQRPFAGKSQASVIAAILQTEPPPIAKLLPMAPPGLDRVVRACLAKDPDERWQCAHDLKRELAFVAAGGPQADAPGRGARAGGPRWAAAVGMGALLALAVGLGAYRLGRSDPEPEQKVMRLVAALPEGEALQLGRGAARARAPGGTPPGEHRGAGGAPQLSSRALDQLEATALAGTEGADAPFFSPDGQWVGFFAGGKLKKVPATGGAPLTLCDASDARGGSFGPDDTIVFTPGNFSGLARVSANGGTPATLTTPDESAGERTHRWPQVLPGGEAALVTVGIARGTSFDEARIGVVSLATGKLRLLSEHGFHARYVSSGHLLYVRGDTLLAAPFDLRRLVVTGASVPVLEGLRTNASGGAHFSVSDTGALAYLPGGALEADRGLVLADRKGNAQPVSDKRGDFMFPRVSPDGRRVAVSTRMGTPDVWVLDVERGTFARLTSGPGNRTVPAWTPDGSRIAYWSGEPGRDTSLYWKAADGSGSEELLLHTGSPGMTSAFSPDGRHLAYDEHDTKTGWNVWVVPLTGERKPRMFAGTPADELGPAFSPDGRWLAYHSNESGRVEVYVRAFPGPGGRYQVSNEGGENAVWARNGREIFYRFESKWMAVDVATGATLRIGAPHLLFEGRYLPGVYDVHPDGRFLLVQPREESRPPSHFKLVLGWSRELSRRVAVH
jgi:serine/threonine-protein kinase